MFVVDFAALNKTIIKLGVLSWFGILIGMHLIVAYDESDDHFV